MAQIISQKEDYLHRTHRLLAESRAEKQAQRELDMGELDESVYESRVLDLTDQKFSELNLQYAQEALGRRPMPTVEMGNLPSVMYRAKEGMTQDQVKSVLTMNPLDFDQVLDTKEVPFNQKQEQLNEGWRETPIQAMHSIDKVPVTAQDDAEAIITATEVQTRMDEQKLTDDDLRKLTGLHHKTVEKIISKGVFDDDTAELINKFLPDREIA